MTVHSQLFPYPKRMVVEREILYEEAHPPFQPLFVTSRIFGRARFACLLTLYIIFYALFLNVGAVIFSTLEGPLEDQTRIEVMSAKQDFLTRYPTVLGTLLLLI